VLAVNVKLKVSNYEKDNAACMGSSMQRKTFLHLIAPFE
jgi:hypothetical protein